MDIPDDAVGVVFGFLTVSVRNVARMVCTRWRGAAMTRLLPQNVGAVDFDAVVQTATAWRALAAIMPTAGPLRLTRQTDPLHRLLRLPDSPVDLSVLYAGELMRADARSNSHGAGPSDSQQAVRMSGVLRVLANHPHFAARIAAAKAGTRTPQRVAADADADAETVATITALVGCPVSPLAFAALVVTPALVGFDTIRTVGQMGSVLCCLVARPDMTQALLDTAPGLADRCMADPDESLELLEVAVDADNLPLALAAGRATSPLKLAQFVWRRRSDALAAALTPRHIRAAPRPAGAPPPIVWEHSLGRDITGRTVVTVAALREMDRRVGHTGRRAIGHVADSHFRSTCFNVVAAGANSFLVLPHTVRAIAHLAAMEHVKSAAAVTAAAVTAAATLDCAEQNYMLHIGAALPQMAKEGTLRTLAGMFTVTDMMVNSCRGGVDRTKRQDTLLAVGALVQAEVARLVGLSSSRPRS
jgi:hypothetical protein